MCYEFNYLFEKARARALRNEQQRRAQKHEPPPAPPTSQPNEPKPVKVDETVPV